MRLSELLSKLNDYNFYQIEGFLKNQNLGTGKQRKLNIGKILLNFYCSKCNETRTFSSCEDIYCLGIDEKKVSIDTNLLCGCGNSVQIWYLLESENPIASFAPTIRIVKKSIKLNKNKINNTIKYGEVSSLLNKADILFHENYGAASILYLRISFEKIVDMLATVQGIPFKNNKGKTRNFKEKLIEVDLKSNIIPKEFSSDGYRLFKGLSEIIHGRVDEKSGIDNFPAFRRLIIGILDNIYNSNEILEAIKHLNWNLDAQKEIK